MICNFVSQGMCIFAAVKTYKLGHWGGSVGWMSDLILAYFALKVVRFHPTSGSTLGVKPA